MAAVEPAAVFAALGDGTRLALLKRLSGGEAHSISHLSGETHLTRQAVTKHLQVMERAGLVRSIRVGREARYAYAPDAVAVARTWLDTVSAQWDDAIGRLRAFVED
ncbi:ArsR/SmtB family transcription factor [Zavarzinia sp. CC-PAN008]|uniref:ArsR/SmtB family transcription factor n=1 Tax=Zavarzinia sp. CC-PAN008 TaxID=3243332 RepID=UPI003F746CDB